MEILEQHDDGRFAGEVGEVFGEIGAGTVVQPLRVVTNTAEMRAITHVETEPVGDDVRAGLGSSAERCRHSVFPLGSDRVWIVALLDVEPGGHHLAQQHMGEVLRRRRGSAAEPPNRIGDLGQPTIELAQQARLAHPCIPHDGDDPRSALVHDVLEGLLEFEELGVPPDGLCLHPLDAPAFIELEPARPLSDDHVAVDRAVDTLERECPEWAEGEAAAYMPVGVAGDEHPVLGSLSLEPAGEVHRLPDDAHLLIGPVHAHHDLAGVDPDPHLQRDPVLGLETGVQLAQCGLHRQRCPDGAVRVVLERLVEAKDGHDRVPDELLDHPAVLLDHLPPAGEIGVDHRTDVLGVESTATWR